MLQIDMITSEPKRMATKKVSTEPVNEIIETEAGKEKPNAKRSQMIARKSLHLYRRAWSETQLLDLYTEPLKTGYSYHTISGGDVDSLSYLKIILRNQDLDHCLFSTWCMAQEDIFQFRDWIGAGKIKRLDAYVGEIFPNQYRQEYSLLKKVITPDIGRIAVFKNHAKVYAGTGAKFAFAIESSANINTNPRTEQTAIHLDRKLYEFYKEYYDGIRSFEKDPL